MESHLNSSVKEVLGGVRKNLLALIRPYQAPVLLVAAGICDDSRLN